MQKTRFASHYILLKRLVDCKESLRILVVSNSWKEWVKHGDDHIREMGALVGETINTEVFWEDVETMINITKPIYLLIKFCDGEGANMGEIYEKIDMMLGEIKVTMGSSKYVHSYPHMEKIIIARWTKNELFS